VLKDFQLAFRRLTKAPAFTVIAVMTLALAIGANTAIFSIADAVLFRPLPYSDPDHLYVLMSLDPKTGQRLRSVPFTYLQAITEHHRGLGQVGLRGPTTMTVHRGGDEAEWMETIAVTPEYLRVLGIHPLRGRLFDAADVGQAGSSAVITYEAWQRRFGSDETLIGRSVRLGAEMRVVIGVLPPGVVFPATALNFLYSPTGRTEFLTLGLPPGPTPNPDVPQVVSDGLADEAVVRLEPGVSVEQAQAEIDSLVAPLQEGRTDRVVLVNPRAVLFPTGRPIMALLMVAAALVLLIGCANLANMMLARNRSREREIGMCAALGAARLRIVRPIVFETLIVGLASATVALLLTAASFDLLLRQVPPIAYRSASVRLDGRVAAFALTLGIIAGFAFAVIPAWWSARLDVLTLLKGRRMPVIRRRIAFGHPMVVVQVALAIVLAFGALIAGRALVSVLRVPLGFSPENLLVVNAQPNPFTMPDLRGFYIRAVETLGSRADVLAVGAGGSVPTDGFGRSEAVEISGDQRPVDALYVLPGYLETIGLSVLRGRRLTAEDIARGDVAVLSESAARALFPGRDPIGATFNTRQGRQLVVVGVVNDVKRSLTRQLDPLAYVIPPHKMTRGMTLVARMRTRSVGALTDARREIGRLAPDVAVTAVWWSDSINASTPYRNPRFQTLVLATFAMLAITLTALGIFAVVSFAVATRIHEMGVRLAIGASPSSILRLVVRQALSPVALGLFTGLVATQMLKRIAEAQLYEVDVRDPATLATAAVTVLSAAFFAAYLPARRASRTDPATVLRSE
jgi:putative ABC transport system permease protein